MPSIRNTRMPQPFAKRAGLEPIPGYVLIEPLGRGGFGEVWKCEVPGGLHKAIKFVSAKIEPDGSTKDQNRLEYQAFQQVKTIRHPFLLTLERVEVIGGELLVLMELADQQLGDRFYDCRVQGHAGIPREELLGYLLEAAEALDLLCDKHKLQHLDVKPTNLFVTGGHVQVGDYGLVSKLEGERNGCVSRGLTPEYAAPEVLLGKLHSRSDQFSLAIVYHELLTGAFPYSAGTLQKIIADFQYAEPELSRLPERDRATVRRALAKKPEERFPSCLAFVRALTVAASASAPVNSSRPALITPSKKRLENPDLPTGESDADPAPIRNPLVINAVADPQERPAQKSPITIQSPIAGSLPVPFVARPLRSNESCRIEFPSRVPSATVQEIRPIPQAKTNEQPVVKDTMPAQADVAVSMPVPSAPASNPPESPFPFKLELIQSIFPVEYLLGRSGSAVRCRAEEAVQAIVEAASARRETVPELGKVLQRADGSWVCRFISNIDMRVAQIKLQLLLEESGVTMDPPDGGRVVFRKALFVPVKNGFFGTTLKDTNSGLEVVIQLPRVGRGATEVQATGNLYGTPSAEFAQSAEPIIVKLLEGVLKHLNNIEEKRKHPRIAANFPVTLFPLHPDGGIGPSISGRCKDVSEGGLAIIASSKPSTRHLYVSFKDVPELVGLAILVQLVRSEEQEKDVLIGCRYRLDFGPDSPQS